MSGAIDGSWLFLLWRLFRLAALEGTAKETWALNLFCFGVHGVCNYVLIWVNHQRRRVDRTLQKRCESYQ